MNSATPGTSPFPVPAAAAPLYLLPPAGIAAADAISAETPPDHPGMAIAPRSAKSRDKANARRNGAPDERPPLPR